MVCSAGRNPVASAWRFDSSLTDEALSVPTVTFTNMANRRTYTEDQLREAVATSRSWSAVMAALGKTPGNGSTVVRATAVRLGLDTSHLTRGRNFDLIPRVDLPFSRQPKPGGQTGLSIAARWFLDRGYFVSVPLEPAPYDLVTESDEGLRRVQVKVTSHAEDSGHYTALVARHIYDPTASRNANGSRRRVPYSADSVDYFFIVAPNAMYLVPISSVPAGQTSITLDRKYRAFKIE